MVLDQIHFYRGILYSFKIIGLDNICFNSKFHFSFQEMLKFACERGWFSHLIQPMLDNFDFVFCRSPNALEMILEGERDFILSVNQENRTIHFMISSFDAADELNELGFSGVFLFLATKFFEHFIQT